jgi:hypothetical protein
MQPESILKSDIFFFVATISVIVVALTGVIALAYIIKMVMEVRSAVKNLGLRYRMVHKFIKSLISK